MDFKKTLNKLDDIDSKASAIATVAEVLKKVANLSTTLFKKNLSEILVSNIEKLRKRYPEGFDSNVANERIDANKKYKEEQDLKVRNLVPQN